MIAFPYDYYPSSLLIINPSQYRMWNIFKPWQATQGGKSVEEDPELLVR